MHALVFILKLSTLNFQTLTSEVVRIVGEELGCRESVFQEILEYGDENPDTPEEESGEAMDGVEMEIAPLAKNILG
jgi:hypothetical protein